MDNNNHLDDAVAIQQALMRSASTDNISPKLWWTRATSALETAAASADDWTGFITRSCKKLQIEVLGEQSSVELAVIGARYQDPEVFEAFRSFVQREAIYVTALHRAEKAAQKEANKTNKPAPKAPHQPQQETLI